MDKFAKILSWCVIVLSIIAFFALPIIFGKAFGNQSQTYTQLPLPKISQTITHDVAVYTDNPFDETRWTYINLDDEINCMALNIYFEARNQSTHGQLAVGLVTINIVLSKRYPDSVCDVVWQKRKNKKGKLVAQFSWTLDGLADVPLDTKSWTQSKRMAESLLAEGQLHNIADFTHGATHYHADYVDPFWNDSLTHTITVGDHLFYNTMPVANLQ